MGENWATFYSITWSPCQQASQPVFTSFILQLFKIGLQGNQTNRTSIKKLHKHLHLIGQWCGSVDRAAASDTKGLKFECSHRENLYSAFVFCHTYCKHENKERGREWPTAVVLRSYNNRALFSTHLMVRFSVNMDQHRPLIVFFSFF